MSDDQDESKFKLKRGLSKVLDGVDPLKKAKKLSKGKYSSYLKSDGSELGEGTAHQRKLDKGYISDRNKAKADLVNASTNNSFAEHFLSDYNATKTTQPENTERHEKLEKLTLKYRGKAEKSRSEARRFDRVPSKKIGLGAKEFSRYRKSWGGKQNDNSHMTKNVENKALMSYMKNKVKRQLPMSGGFGGGSGMNPAANTTKKDDK